MGRNKGVAFWLEQRACIKAQMFRECSENNTKFSVTRERGDEGAVGVSSDCGSNQRDF